MKYVYIENGVVVDRVQVDPFTVFYPEYASRFIQAPEEVDHFWTYDGEKFSPPVVQEVVEPPKPTKEQLLAELEALTAKIKALE